MKFNFIRKLNSQDIIASLAKELNTTYEDAIISSVTEDLCNTIIDAGWAEIAYGGWRHAEWDYTMQSISPKTIEVGFTDEQIALIERVKNSEKAPDEIAVAFFVMFKLEQFGYHL